MVNAGIDKLNHWAARAGMWRHGATKTRAGQWKIHHNSTTHTPTKKENEELRAYNQNGAEGARFVNNGARKVCFEKWISAISPLAGRKLSVPASPLDREFRSCRIRWIVPSAKKKEFYKWASERARALRHLNKFECIFRHQNNELVGPARFCHVLWAFERPDFSFSMPYERVLWVKNGEEKMIRKKMCTLSAESVMCVWMFERENGT